MANEVGPIVQKQIEATATLALNEGWSVEIELGLPMVSIINPDGETEWFFQEHEAQDLLDEVPDNVNEEDYLLWSSAGW